MRQKLNKILNKNLTEDEMVAELSKFYGKPEWKEFLDIRDLVKAILMVKNNGQK